MIAQPFRAFLAVGVLAWLWGCKGGLSGPDEFVIAERGKPAACTIVYANDAAPAVRYAAEELRDYVKKLTDVDLPINGKAECRIHLVNLLIDEEFRACVRSLTGVSLTVVSPDGFNVVRKGDGLWILGEGPRGCLYGVYELLERFGGVGFYTSWCEKIPQIDRLAVPADCALAESPAFAMREPFWYDLIVHPEFAAKLRANGRNHMPGELPAKFGKDDFRFGGGLPSCHTFNKLCDPKVYFDQHPEYFSLVKGKRLKEHTQLCLTNPDVLDIVTSNVLARIRKDPGAKFYGVSQNDNRNYCECERCAAVDAEEGSHAGTVIRFVNAIAETVEANNNDYWNCTFINGTVGFTKSGVARLMNCAVDGGLGGNWQSFYLTNCAVLATAKTKCKVNGSTDWYDTIEDCRELLEAADSKIVATDAAFKFLKDDVDIRAFYAPKRRSPLVAAGRYYPWMTKDATDILGRPRSIDGIVDIGCCAYAPKASGLMLLLR